MSDRVCPGHLVATSRAGRPQCLAVALWALVAAAALTVPVPAHADERALSLPVEEYELANGLKVRLAPDPSLDEVTVIVHCDVGSADSRGRCYGRA